MRILILFLLAGCTPYPDQYAEWEQPWNPEGWDDPPRVIEGTTVSLEHRFRLHHGDRDPDRVDTIFASAEAAWQLNLDWGASPPPADDGAGPDELIDIYLVDELEHRGVARRIGFAYQGGCAGETEVLDRPSIPLGEVRSTLNHKVRHLFQFFTNCRPLVFAEPGATMAAWAGEPEFVATERSWLWDFQQTPGRSVFATPGDDPAYEYGAWLFHRFVAERYGDGTPAWFTQQVLQAGGSSAFEQLDEFYAAVAAEGDTPQELFADFGIARLMTPDRGEDAWWADQGPWMLNALDYEYIGVDAADFTVGLEASGSTYVAFDPGPGFVGRLEGDGDYRHVLVVRPEGDGPWVYFPAVDGVVELPPSQVWSLGFWAVTDVRWHPAAGPEDVRLLVERP